MDLNSNPTVSGVTLSGNGINGLQVDSGTLGKDLIWDDPEIVYRLDFDVTVPAGRTLTIEPGQIIKPADRNLDLFIDGTLNINGTETSPVVFTSVEDDTRGGDTNGDGNATAPGPGEWARIMFRDASSGNTIDHAEFHYGGYFVGTMVQAVNTDLTVTNSLFASSASDGLRLEGTDAVVTNNVFQNNLGAATSMDLNSNPTITGGTITDNGINGLQVDWGTVGKDLIWDDPDIVYRLDFDITVPVGKTLTIGAGQIIKPADRNLDLFVDGTLNITGSEAEPVIFTSVEDDTRGGDTNGDGNATVPAPGEWARIMLRETSSGNSIDHAEFHYGGYFVGSMVQAVNTDLTVTNSLFASSATDGLRLEGTDAVVIDNVFENNLGAAASMNLSANPTISGVSVTGNGINGLQVDAGIVGKDLIWDDPDIVYQLDFDITVPAGRTLTIDAGQIIKLADRNLDLFVDGTLNITGTANQPVVFTSVEDDTRGGDTNGDGVATTPAPGEWAQIRLRETSSGNSIEHAEFHYGGYFVGSMLQGVNTELTVTNSLFASSASDGLRLEGTDAVVTDNAFRNNLGAAASMNLNSNPTITGVTGTGNGINGLQVDWGTIGKDLIWDDPDIVYRLDSDITVPVGRTLTIDAGQIIKPADRNLDLFINGTLNVTGSEAEPVIFTSVEDDTRGGDTNGDADATAPAAGEWARILMGETSTANTIDHAEFHYGGYFVGSMIQAIDTDLAITNSVFAHSAGDGIRLQGTDAIATNNSFHDNLSAAVSMDLNSNPVINGVTVSRNGINGLQLDAGTIAKDLAWDDPDIVYRPDGDVTVPTGKTLTIGAGQIVKPADANTELLINGTLQLLGSVSNPVVITSILDDTAGGDTNNDGGATTPLPGNWARILFNAGSANNVVEHADLRFGGYFYGGTLVSDNAPLSVENTIVQDSASYAIRGINSATIEVSNSVMTGNGSGAIGAFSASQVSAVNNTMSDNYRGVLASGNAQVELTNNLITFQSLVGVAAESGGSVMMSFNDIYNPDSINFSGVTDPTGTAGNLSADPKYFSRVNRQFQLRSGSPASDSGTSDGAPLLDYLGQARFDDPNVLNTGGGLEPFFDMGAYERQTLSTSRLDLETVSVTGVTSAIQDDIVSVGWTVKNIGSEVVSGSWHDGIFLSVDPIWTPDDLFLGDFEHAGNLGPGSSYAASGSVTLPGVLPGDYYFIVRSDVRNEVFEALLEPNNARASGIVSVDLPQLPLGNPIQGTLRGTNDYKLYRVAVPDGADLTVDVSGPTSVSHELFIAYEELPSRQRFDQRGIRPDTPDQTLSVANTRAGDYIVLVYGADVPSFGATFTLSATLQGFGIDSITPFQGANLGNVTVTVNGAQFNGNTELQLIDTNGAAINASQVFFMDSGEVVGTFDLSGAAIGPADVRVINPGNVTTELPDAFNIIEGVPGQLQAVARVPSRVRGGRTFNGFIEYRNTGHTDLLLPFLTVTTSGLDLLDLNEDRSGASTRLDILGANPNAPAGILPPGAIGRIPIFGQSTGGGMDTITVSAGVFPDTPIPWDSLKSQLMPEGADPVEFDRVFQQIRTQIGDQWQSYAAAISEDASLLPPSMGSPQNLQDVFSIEILKARAALGTKVAGRLFLNDVSDTLVDATMTLINTEQGVAYNAVSLNDGSFVFTEVMAGNYELVIDGFHPLSPVEVQVDQADVDLGDTVVSHGGEINGSVLLDRFGVPARDVLVSAASEAGFFVTRTDVNGHYRLQGLPAATYQLSTQSDFHSSITLPAVTVPAARVVPNINLAVESSASIQGTVLGPGGTPIEGARVFATIAGINGQSDTTDSAGRFVIQGLSSGQYNVVVTADGFAPSVTSGVQLSSGGSVTELTANLLQAGRLSGTVQSSATGQGVSYALLALFDGDTVVGSEQADSDGVFDLANVATGTYTALVSANGFLNLEQSVTITASQTTAFSPTLEPAGKLAGQLRDASGQPLAGLLVSAEDRTQGFGGFAVSDATGHYTINNLPLGIYDVRVGARAGVGLAHRAVTFVSGSVNQSIDFDLDVAGTVSGTVHGTSGQPLAGATVRLIKAGITVHETYTGADGSYSFVILQAGQYDLGAGGKGLVFPILENVTVDGGNPLTIDFQPGSESLTGILADEITGDPIEGATVLLSQSVLGYGLSSPGNQMTAADGSFSFNGLAPGEYDIQFLVPGKATILETVVVQASGGGLPGGAWGNGDAGSSMSQSGSPLSFQAKPGFNLSGTLRTEFAGLPIPSGQIDVYRQSDGKRVGTVGTDSTGNYQLGGLPDGLYDIVASGGGRQQASLQSVGVSGGDTFVDISLPTSSTSISGTVNGTGLGPLDLAHVKISDTATGRVTEFVEIKSDSSFSTGTLPPGDYTARVVGDGLFSQPVSFHVTPGENSGFVFDATSVASSGQDEPFVSPIDPPAPGTPGWYDAIVDNTTLDQILQELINQQIPAPAKGCEALHAQAVALFHKSRDFVANARAARDAQRVTVKVAGFDSGLDADNAVIAANALIVAGDIASLITAVKGAVDAVANLDDNVKAAMQGREAAVEAAEFLKYLASEKKADLFQLGNKIYGIGQNIVDSIKTGSAPPPTIVLDVESALVDISNLARDILIKFQSSPNLIAVGTLSTVILGPVNSLISLILNTKAAVDDYNKSIKGIADRAEAARNADAFSALVSARYRAAIARLSACNAHGPDAPGAPPAPGGATVSVTPVSNVISVDPNDKSGAAGIGDENFVSLGTIPYLIQFENDPDLGATVPAQEVFVTDTLDPDLDLSTLEFTGFGFNNFTFDVPAGLSRYEEVIDLRPDGIDLIVEVVLDVDVTARVLTASFRSLDPLTMQLPDAIDAGFLPVNDKQIGNGEGFFTYTVAPASDLTTGTQSPTRQKSYSTSMLRF